MKKILLTILISLIFICFVPSKNVEAFSSGSGYYGDNVDGYEKIDVQYKYTKGTRIPLWIGGTDKHEYFTYYLYYKLRINTIGIADDSFKRIYNSKITGSFVEIYELKKEYQMTSSIDWKVIDGASINLALKNYQSWRYRYVQGEEIEFSLKNNSTYGSIALIALEIKIVERYVLEEVEFGGFSGSDEVGRRRYAPVHNEYYFVVDYDLLPVNFSDLSGTDQNKFELINGKYLQKYDLVFPYIPNFNQRYYDFLSDSSKRGYYIK